MNHREVFGNPEQSIRRRTNEYRDPLRGETVKKQSLEYYNTITGGLVGKCELNERFNETTGGLVGKYKLNERFNETTGGLVEKYELNERFDQTTGWLVGKYKLNERFNETTGGLVERGICNQYVDDSNCWFTKEQNEKLNSENLWEKTYRTVRFTNIGGTDKWIDAKTFEILNPDTNQCRKIRASEEIWYTETGTTETHNYIGDEQGSQWVEETTNQNQDRTGCVIT